MGWCSFDGFSNEGMMIKDSLQQWYDLVENHDAQKLSGLLADTVVFHSPVVHRPQEGKALTFMYLSAAVQVLNNDTFHYTGEYTSETGAVLEFKTTIEGIEINGIDMITFDADGKIRDFKVMIRPLKAVNKLHEMMKTMLESMAGKSPR
jgi:SnoaL-like domain